MYSPKIVFTGFALVVGMASWAGSGCSSSSGTGGSTTSSGTNTTGSTGGGTVGSSATTSTGGGGGTGGTTTASSSATSTSSSATTSSGTTTTTCPASTGTPPANTMCPGEEHTLALGGTPLVINGTTVGATANYPYCNNPPETSPAASPDVVYAITLAAAGTLSATLAAGAGSTLVPALDVRTDCAMPSVKCVATGTATQNLTADLAAGTYYFIVSGGNCTAGAFTLTLSLTAEVCGNGVIDPGEDCDPGANPPANDGCGSPTSATPCQFIAPTQGDTCATAQVVTVPVSTTLAPFTIVPASAGTSNYGYNDDYTGSCTHYTGGRDRVFALTPVGGTSMTVSVGYEADGVTSMCAVTDPSPSDCWAHVIYARKTCADTTSEIANTCVDNFSGDPTAPSTVTFPVTTGTPVYFFVDGYDEKNYSYGPFNLIVKLQ